MNKRKLGIVFILLLGVNGCAVNAPVEDKYVLDVSYLSSRNDLSTEARPMGTRLFYTQKPVRLGKENVELPLDYAVKCNEKKSQCNHAVVKPTLMYDVVVDEQGVFNIHGAFESETGYSKKKSGASGWIERFVPKNTPLWELERDVLEFHMTPSENNQLILEGVAGNKLELKLIKK